MYLRRSQSLSILRGSGRSGMKMACSKRQPHHIFVESGRLSMWIVVCTLHAGPHHRNIDKNCLDRACRGPIAMKYSAIGVNFREATHSMHSCDAKESIDLKSLRHRCPTKSLSLSKGSVHISLAHRRLTNVRA